jgi:putative hydrolase of the HAD superfamily
MRAFLFDLDDTLFDHLYSTRVALQAVCEHLPALATVAPDDLQVRHARVLEELHLKVLAGAIDVDAARIERLTRLVEMHGARPVRSEIESAAAEYRRAYLAARRPVVGAVPVLAALRPHGAIAVVSNNVSAEQAGKMAVCGIADHVDALIVSEVVGVAKPDPKIFRVALERLGANRENAVMIGDSWGADVMGARAADIRAIWFNPARRPFPEPAEVPEIHGWQPTSAAVDQILSAFRYNEKAVRG